MVNDLMEKKIISFCFCSCAYTHTIFTVYTLLILCILLRISSVLKIDLNECFNSDASGPRTQPLIHRKSKYAYRFTKRIAWKFLIKVCCGLRKFLKLEIFNKITYQTGNVFQACFKNLQ